MSLTSPWQLLQPLAKPPLPLPAWRLCAPVENAGEGGVEALAPWQALQPAPDRVPDHEGEVIAPPDDVAHAPWQYTAQVLVPLA